MKSDFFYSVEIVPIALRQFPKAIFLLNNYVCTVLIYILLEAFLFFTNYSNFKHCRTITDRKHELYEDFSISQSAISNHSPY